MGFFGNKGGIGISFKVAESSILCIGVHLAGSLD